RIAEIYDHARSAEADPALTFADPATGRRHSYMWLVPRSAEDLGTRRRVHRFWAEPSYGLMGRTPDHVACVLTAFAAWRQLFDRGGVRFGDSVVRFYERARDEDLYLAYAIVPPQVDRSQPSSTRRPRTRWPTSSRSSGSASSSSSWPAWRCGSPRCRRRRATRTSRRRSAGSSPPSARRSTPSCEPPSASR